MLLTDTNRASRFFFMSDEPPASGTVVPTPAEIAATKSETDPAETAQRLLKKAQDELASVRAELTAIKEAELSEVERLKKRSTELELRAQASEHELLRRRVAQEENVPVDALEYLSGSDEDTLRGSARKLVTLIGSKTSPTTLGTRTQPGVGQVPTIDDQIAAAEKSGNRVLSISLKNQKMRTI